MTSPSPLEDVAHGAPLEFIFGATHRIVRLGATPQSGRLHLALSGQLAVLIGQELWRIATNLCPKIASFQQWGISTQRARVRVSGTSRLKDRLCPCPTNDPRQNRHFAQAALELCGSPEHRDLVTFISSMSLNAELVACRTWSLRHSL
jgi:hypothetical protein